MAELRRQLSLADGIAVFAGTILGSGIFMAPAGVASATPHPVSAVLLWGLGALVAAGGASCYAECGARLPQAGGFFVFLRTAYGRPVAFVAGWVALLITYPASIAAMAIVFGGYFGQIVGFDVAWAPQAFAALALLVAGTLNAVGVRTGALSQRILTGAKVAALAFLVVAALLGPSTAAPSAAAPPAFGVTSFTVLVGVMMWVLWTYDGWSDVTMLSGELENPGRDLGRTVAIGMLVLWVLYSGVQLAVFSLLSPEAAASSEHVLADAVAQRFGGGGGRLLAALAVLTTFGSVNAVVFTSSRLGFAMARDGVFPARFGRIGGGGSPARSIAAITGFSLAYVGTAFFADFTKLLAFFSFSVWIFYGLIALAVLVLRRRGVGEPASFRAPLGPVAPVLVMLTALAMTIGLFVQNPKGSAIGIGIMAAGAVAYAVWQLSSRRARARSGASKA